MLGAMVNNIGAGQTFTVTYTDNSTTTLNQNMSDWFNAAGWPGESVIKCREERNFSDGHGIHPAGFGLRLRISNSAQCQQDSEERSRCQTRGTS